MPPWNTLIFHTGGEKWQSWSLQHMADHVCGGDLSGLADDTNEFFVSLCHDVPPLTDHYSVIECDSVTAKYIISVENAENQSSRLDTKKQETRKQPNLGPTWSGPLCAYWNFSIRDGQIINPDNKVHGANMGPNWGQQDPGGPHVGHMNLAI